MEKHEEGRHAKYNDSECPRLGAAHKDVFCLFDIPWTGIYMEGLMYGNTDERGVWAMAFCFRVSVQYLHENMIPYFYIT
jgi:hypothetical protein